MAQLLVYLSSANKSQLVHYRGTFGFVRSAFVSWQTKEFLMRKILQPGFCPRLPLSKKVFDLKETQSKACKTHPEMKLSVVWYAKHVCPHYKPMSKSSLKLPLSLNSESINIMLPVKNKTSHLPPSQRERRGRERENCRVVNHK